MGFLLVVGMDVVFSNESEDEVDVNVIVNEKAFFCWALQYGQHIEVLEPTDLRERVKNAIMEISKKYGG